MKVEGEFKAGVPEGEAVTIDYPNGDQYKGPVREGKLHGYGKYTYSNGMQFRSYSF